MRAIWGWAMKEACGVTFRVTLGAVALLSCLAVGVGANAQTGFFSGNDLWRECENPQKLAFCYGYIIGATDAAGMEQIVLKDAFHVTNKPLFCFGPGVQAE